MNLKTGNCFRKDIRREIEKRVSCETLFVRRMMVLVVSHFPQHNFMVKVGQ